MEPILKRNEIICISGRLCSGKGYVIERDYPNHLVVVVSDIVRMITQKSARRDLQNTANLDVEIVKVIMGIIANNSDKSICIDGIRQISILNELLRLTPQREFKLVWVHADRQVRLDRYDARADKKDNDDTFKGASERDEKLGVGEIEDYFRQYGTTINNN